MIQLKTILITFITAVNLLLGVFVVSLQAESLEPMPPLPWSDEEPISPIVRGELPDTKPESTKSDSTKPIGEAFKLPQMTSVPKNTRNEIATKLAARATTSEQTKSATQPYHATSEKTNSTVAQLERIAQEANSVHALGRLINRCQKTLTTNRVGEPLSDEDRLTVNRITGWAYTARGQARYDSGNADEAIKDFTTALVFDPYHTSAYLNRGIVLAELSTESARQKALVDFSQVLSQEPDHLIAYRNRATLYLEIAEPAKALRDSRQGIKAWGKQSIRSLDLIVSLYELEGNALLQLNRSEQAIETYDLALHYDPESSTVRLRRGALLASKGRYQIAINDLLASLNSPKVTNAESAEAYRCLAWLLATCPEPKYRDASKAVEAAKRAIRLSNPEEPKLLQILAVAHAAAGDFSQAIQYQQKVVFATTGANERQAAMQRLTQFEQGILIELPKPTASKNLRRATYNKQTSRK